MSLLSKSVVRSVMINNISKRLSSTESPKITIAKHLLLLKEIAAAKDEATLTKIASSGLPNFDINNPPAELEDFKSYFALASIKKGEKFIPDPTAWQNMDALPFAATELQRAETWPFFVGFITVVLVLGVGVAVNLPKDARDHSKYIAMLEGRKQEH